MTDTFVPWNPAKPNSVGWVEVASGCHVWTGCTDRDGYGFVGVNGKNKRPHRIRYEREVGPIPAGLQIDHLCGNPACCNPAHLEAVTSRVNTMRGNTPAARNAAKTHCIHGHPLIGENLKVRDGRRRCRTCINARLRKSRAANPDVYLERGRAYRDANRETLRQRQRQRSAANRDTINANQRARREPLKHPRQPKTHCPHGHPYTSDNLVPSMLKVGHKACRTCWNERNRIRSRAKRAAAKASAH